MCGISGHVGGIVDPAIAGEQVRRLTHRGPDAQGAYSVESGVVAQNRLAIIDLVTADPPLTNEDATVGVVLNGEIYNFQALRDELQRGGHRFSSRCDTEVLAHLAEDEPDACALARRLQGMFAFAIWSEREGRLVLGRDRLGKKPLYYWTDDRVLVFGSEIKALLAHPSVPEQLDPEAIPAYLTFGYVPTPRTFYAGIHSLEPGHVLTFSPGAPPAIEPYWQAPLCGTPERPHRYTDLDAAARRTRRLLTEAVERRLVADVPLGAFLSGGIDSSAIVAIMAGPLGRRVQTFTIGFDDRQGFDERPHARTVAKLYGTDHHEFVVAPNAVDLVEKLVWHHDQPFGDSSAIPTYLLNELTRKHVTVALSGDGGDELFAGYERFAAATAAARYRSLPAPVRRAARAALAPLPRTALRGRAGSAQRFARHAERPLLEAYRSWVGIFDDADAARLGAPVAAWARSDYERIWAQSAGAPLLDRILHLNLRTYLLDDLLVKADRMSMAHALEVRSPFLDHELVEFAAAIAPGVRMRGFDLKRVLKRAVAGLLPEEIVNRRKRGFGVPLDRWFREDLAPYVTGTLGAPDARVRAHLRGAGVDDLLAEHASGRVDHGHRLWTLLTLEVFLRRQGW
jgi:asparagine synthase (glutamine-hydrolysing)